MGGDLRFSNFDGGQMGAQQNNFTKLLSIDDVCEILGVSRSYILQRTGPNSKKVPRIPTIKGLKPLRFHPQTIQDLFLTPPSVDLKSSLKIEKTEKIAVKVRRSKKGDLVSLW